MCADAVSAAVAVKVWLAERAERVSSGLADGENANDVHITLGCSGSEASASAAPPFSGVGGARLAMMFVARLNALET